MKICRVVNKYKSDFDVNIHRGTFWGNYVGKEASSREEAIELFKKDFIKRIRSGEITKAHLEPLRGMRLGCTCKPKACHGDIIALVVNKLFKDEFNIEDICK
ncbi:hypothetical protein [Escherichia phage AV117]|nr:hypothetical protein [Escherichia phage AV117]